MKKTFTLMLSFIMALCLCLTACGDNNSSTVTVSSAAAESTAAESTTAAEATAAESITAAESTTAEESTEPQLFKDLDGTYDELFTVICDPQYDQLWLDDCAAIVGEEGAAGAAEMLKSACTGTIYGEEAVEAYGDGSNGAFFDCYFINGISQFTFNGNTISGTDENGKEVFCYEYTDEGTFSLGGMMEGELYETEDKDAGEFKYFLIMPDTPATTWHIEFRYGSSKEDLAEYNKGSYAYWLAAGILADRDEQMVKDVINLFCEENLSGGDEGQSSESEESAEADTVFAGGDGTAEDPWQVTTAEQLDRVRDDLTAHYILVEDIDLSGYENWIPIGAFQPLSDAPEDAEIPHPDYAFTGTFDGAGHTISNLTISCEAPMGTGLFGCAFGTENGAAFISHFTLKDVNVSGCYLVGSAVGLQFMNCPVSDVHLVGNNKLTGMQGIGGIVGTGFDLISDCSATADIIAQGDDGACAGLIAGGTTMSSIQNCEVTGGSISAEGNVTWGFGALCGAPWGAAEITDCKVSGTVITVSGENNRLVGGLVGFGGTYDPAAPAQITGCIVEDVTINVSETTDSVGGLIGAGKEMMEGSDVMSSFTISDCTVSGNIIGGREYVDAVVGDPACAVSVDCTGGMTVSAALNTAA